MAADIRHATGASLIDVLDRVLDKGIVVDADMRVTLAGIDLVSVNARFLIASFDTHLAHAAVGGSGWFAWPNDARKYTDEERPGSRVDRDR